MNGFVETMWKGKYRSRDNTKIEKAIQNFKHMVPSLVCVHIHLLSSD
jgi:hypothetical protein